MEYAAVFVLATLVAIAELVARYKDNPVNAIWSPPAMFYVGLNGVVGIAALYVLNVLAPDLFANAACTDNDANTFCPPVSIGRILSAGFGSLVVMRSAFARMTIGGQDIGVGPSAIIETFQRAADRGVDRMRAFKRMDELPKNLRELPLDFVSTTLMALCIELMQNLSAEEKQALDQRIKLVSELKVHEEMRSLIVALILQEFVGKKVLTKAVNKIMTDYGDVLKAMGQQRREEAERVGEALF